MKFLKHQNTRITCLQSPAAALGMDLFADIKGIKGLSGQTGHQLHFIMLVFLFFMHAVARYLFYRLRATVNIFVSFSNVFILPRSMRNQPNRRVHVSRIFLCTRSACHMVFSKRNVNDISVSNDTQV